MFKSVYVCLFSVFVSFYAFGQLYSCEIGMINDPDDFTYLRDSGSSESAIIDTISTSDFFMYFENDTSQWFEARLFYKRGFIHKSRVQDVSEVSRSQQVSIIKSVFKTEKENYKCWIEKVNCNPDLSNYHDDHFQPCLTMFLAYMKKDFDEALLDEFFDLLIVEEGSADELPSCVIGELFLEYPDEILSKLKDKNHRILNAHLEFGFENVSYGGRLSAEDEQKLRVKLDEFYSSLNK